MRRSRLLSIWSKEILFGYNSETVSHAEELTSVHICYSQGNGFYTPLSIFYILHTQSVVCDVLGYVGARCSVVRPRNYLGRR